MYSAQLWVVRNVYGVNGSHLQKCGNAIKDDYVLVSMLLDVGAMEAGNLLPTLLLRIDILILEAPYIDVDVSFASAVKSMAIRTIFCIRVPCTHSPIDSSPDAACAIKMKRNKWRKAHECIYNFMNQ